MNCQEYEQKILDQVDGLTSPSDDQDLQAHVLSCPSCADYLRQAMQLDLQLASGLAVPRLSPDFESDLWRRIETEQGSPSALSREEKRRLWQAEYESRLRDMRRPFSLLQPVLDHLGYGVLGGMLVYASVQAATKSGISWGGVSLQVAVLGLAGIVFSAGLLLSNWRPRFGRMER